MISDRERIAKEVAQAMIGKALDEVLGEIQINIVESESDSEREMWVLSRNEVRTIEEIVSAPNLAPKAKEDLFQSDKVSKRRKAVLELWNKGGLTQREIAEYLNESAYNVRQDLTQFRKKGVFVRKTSRGRKRKF